MPRILDDLNALKNYITDQIMKDITAHSFSVDENVHTDIRQKIELMHNAFDFTLANAITKSNIEAGKNISIVQTGEKTIIEAVLPDENYYLQVINHHKTSPIAHSDIRENIRMINDRYSTTSAELAALRAEILELKTEIELLKK